MLPCHSRAPREWTSSGESTSITSGNLLRSRSSFSNSSSPTLNSQVPSWRRVPGTERNGATQGPCVRKAGARRMYLHSLDNTLRIFSLHVCVCVCVKEQVWACTTFIEITLAQLTSVRTCWSFWRTRCDFRLARSVEWPLCRNLFSLRFSFVARLLLSSILFMHGMLRCISAGSCAWKTCFVSSHKKFDTLFRHALLSTACCGAQTRDEAPS